MNRRKTLNALPPASKGHQSLRTAAAGDPLRHARVVFLLSIDRAVDRDDQPSASSAMSAWWRKLPKTVEVSTSLKRYTGSRVIDQANRTPRLCVTSRSCARLDVPV